jgi:hypothetical protein
MRFNGWNVWNDLNNWNGFLLVKEAQWQRIIKK